MVISQTFSENTIKGPIHGIITPVCRTTAAHLGNAE